MYSGGPSSPACATVKKPSPIAFLNNFSNFLGGLPISEESKPTPIILSLCSKAISNILNPEASSRCLRKHIIISEVRPNSLFAFWRAL